MTLREVAARLVAPVAGCPVCSQLTDHDREVRGMDCSSHGVASLAYAKNLLEADPEFTLPERLEALAKEWEAFANQTPEEKIRAYQQTVERLGLPTSVGATPGMGMNLLEPGAAARRLREIREGKA